MHPQLGRLAPPDQRHVELYPFKAPAPGSVEVEIKRPKHDYDQAQTPRCAGFAFSKLMGRENGYIFDADWLYVETKKHDAWPGEDGTSARYICDTLRTQGHLRMIGGKDVKMGAQLAHGIASNSWATTVDQMRAVLAAPKPQPIPIGIEWLSAWFSPVLVKKDYWLQNIDVAGSSAGGHELCVFAASDSRAAFGLSNNWGLGWPDPQVPDSLVWMPYATMDWLFARGSDACVIEDLPTR